MANLVFDFLHHYQTGERRASDPADAYQYDEGHVMEAVVPVEVTSCEIHYWVRGQEEAEAYTPESITQNEDGSYSIIGHIPNTYFETYGELRVYIVVTDGTASITTYEGRIHICERSKPDDYVDDDPDNEAVKVIAEARAAAATATQKAGEAAESAEQAQEILDSIPEDYSQLSEDVSDLKDEISQLSGLSEDVKQALLQLAEKVTYIDDDGQTYYDDLYDALYPPAELVSISAVYTQTKTIYNTDDLDKLESDLVVTAHMSDSTTQTVTDYVLSGTLAVGTSTITVTYGGKTTTFTVTVTAGLYPMTITASDNGVGFGSVDSTKNTMTPPYRANTNKTRAYAYGANALGYEINPAKQYRISVTATEDVNVNMIIHEFNETAYSELQNVEAVTTGNKTATSWMNITPSTPYTYTPTPSINGEPPVCIWLTFKQADGGGWAALDGLFPITIEQL